MAIASEVQSTSPALCIRQTPACFAARETKISKTVNKQEVRFDGAKRDYQGA
jgi:hypothetical protein